MKYIVILCDGMSDYPLDELGGLTPMQKAEKPNMDMLAKTSEIGLCKTIPVGMKPGSDVANLSVMGYNPADCYTGRSPLEAASIGIDMESDDIALRCNLVTLSDENDYEQKTMVDYCGGDISTAEARELVEALQKHFGNAIFKFYSGVSYRHCLIWKHGCTGLDLTPPHDISGRIITEYLSGVPDAKPLIDMMKDSFEVLKDHPVNKKRVSEGKHPANSAWFWGEGKKTALKSFSSIYGIKGSVVSAVDLIKGIGKCADMEVAEVEGATGYIDTNFEGKAAAALRELKNDQDLVYVHIEAPDECGHRGETENKVKSIELIDKLVLGPIIEGLAKYDDYKIMILPDHPTPLSTRTHAADPVPYMIYQKSKKHFGADNFSELSAKKSGLILENGYTLMKYFINL